MLEKPNVVDFLPILRRLDPQGIRMKTEFHIEQAFEIAGEFIKEGWKVCKKDIMKGREKIS